MNVKILGTGCVNCKRLEGLVEEAASDAGLELEVEKVTEIPAIMAYGVMSTPGLVVNGEVKASGRVPSKAEIAGWLRPATSEEKR
jgi:small redox-active disulfide protein 2